VEWSIRLEGARVEVEYDDHNLNHVTTISLMPDIADLSITASGIVETADRAGVLGKHIGRTPLWIFSRQTELTKPGPKLRALVNGLGTDKEDVLGRLHELSTVVLDAVAYEPGYTDVATSAEDALTAGRGVCQDHAHVFVGGARLLGIPARYVSGYLMMDDRTDQEAGHGWAEAHVDGLGWVGFDVSNGISPDARYVRVASGRDYHEAAPVKGITFGQSESTLAVRLAVEQQSVQQ